MKSGLTEEIDSIPRRSTYFAREKVYTEDDQQIMQKNVYETIKNYLNEETKLGINELQSGETSIDSETFI